PTAFSVTTSRTISTYSLSLHDALPISSLLLISTVHVISHQVPVIVQLRLWKRIIHGPFCPPQFLQRSKPSWICHAPTQQIKIPEVFAAELHKPFVCNDVLDGIQPDTVDGNIGGQQARDNWDRSTRALGPKMGLG